MGKYQPKDGPYWIEPCERKDCPTKGWHAHAEDVEGVQIPDEVVEEICAEQVERVVPGPIAADGALPRTWTAGVEPKPQTVIAAHYDASAEDGESVCACGSDFADLAALKGHIAEEKLTRP